MKNVASEDLIASAAALGAVPLVDMGKYISNSVMKDSTHGGLTTRQRSQAWIEAEAKALSLNKFDLEGS